MAIGKAQAFGGKTVKVRSLRERMTVASKITPAEIVGQEDYDIWQVRSRNPTEGYQQEECKK